MDSITSNKWVSFITQPAFLLTVIALVAGICVVNTYLRLTAPLSQPAHVTQAPLSTEVKTGLSSNEIIALDLFGSTAPQQASQKNHQDIPETKLKLVLKGAFTNSDAEMASALIAEDRNRRAELYRVGDELPGNAVLDEVYPDYVVIKRGIQLEKLLFLRNLPETERGLQNSNERASVTIQPTTGVTPKPQVPDPITPSLTPNTATPKSLYEIREQHRQQNK